MCRPFDVEVTRKEKCDVFLGDLSVVNEASREDGWIE